MEVGFPISSPGDFSAVNTIAKTVKNSCVCGLARAVDKDIIACAEALKPAENFRIHTFIATSDIHLQTKLHKTFDEVCEMAVHSIKLAKNYTDNVEFSCEDAGRTSVDNLCVIIEKAIAAGATTINIPRRRDHHQHPGHRRLQPPERVRRQDQGHHRESSQYRQVRPLCPLPQ